MQIENKVKQTIKKYKLLSKKDRILVACSGGKDSTTILYILNKLGYKPEAITVDALIGNYTKHNLKNITEFCKQHNIRLHVISFRKEFGYSLCYLKSLINSKGSGTKKELGIPEQRSCSKGFNLKSCTICGVLRRYLLNKHARKLKATKLITGHNLNDEAQAIMMNLFKNNIEILSRLGPSTGTIKDKKFVQRVKPLYFVTEQEVIDYSKKQKFPVKYSHCPCRAGAYRDDINKVLEKYEKTNPYTTKNIVKWFLKISPNLKQKFKSTQKQAYCKDCGEPSRKDQCMTCQILAKIK